MISYAKLAKKLRENYTTTQIRNEKICSQKTYYAIMHDNANLTISTLIKFSELFNCSINDLIDIIPDNDNKTPTINQQPHSDVMGVV